MISVKLQCVCYLRFLDNQTKELSKDDLADTLIWLFYKFVSFGGNWNKLDKIVWNRLVVILFVSRVGSNFLCLTNPVHRLLIYSGAPTYTLSILLFTLESSKIFVALVAVQCSLLYFESYVYISFVPVRNSGSFIKTHLTTVIDSFEIWRRFVVIWISSIYFYIFHQKNVAIKLKA